MITIHLTHKLNEILMLDVNFTAAENEITAIVGPSGTGKSTLLNLITGMLTPDDATISDESQCYVNTIKKQKVDVHLRQFGYVQQKPNLFPHLTVYENLVYGCRSVNDHCDHLNELVDIFELNPHLEKHIKMLSGGEAKRVAIVRTLMTNPKLLLLDEPFSALDPVLKHKLQAQFLQLKTKLNIPILMVTHDLEEAFEMSDKLIFLERGKIVEALRTETLFTSYKKKKTAQYLGVINFITLTKKMNSLMKHLKLSQEQSGKTVAIATHDITLSKNGLDATVIQLQKKVSHIILKAMLSEGECVVEFFVTYSDVSRDQITVGSLIKINVHQGIVLEEIDD